MAILLPYNSILSYHFRFVLQQDYHVQVMILQAPLQISLNRVSSLRPTGGGTIRPAVEPDATGRGGVLPVVDFGN